MPKIFISYRREDSIEITGRIYDRLEARFGAESVFMDIDAIPIGVDFRQHLNESVTACDVVLAVIAPKWLTVSQNGTRRLDDARDFVRIEIEAALKCGIPVVPVLIGSVAMPREDELPDVLKPLAHRHAARIDVGQDFRSHADRLIRALERITGLSAKPSTSTPAQSQPQLADTTEIVLPLPDNVIAAWRKGGALVGWMDRHGRFRSDYEPGTLPAFQFKLWKTGVVSALPVPTIPFWLLLNDCEVRDAGLKELVGLKSLQSLGLYRTQVTDAGLKVLGGLKGLEWLSLEGTGVTDGGLKELAGLKGLLTLSLGSTMVTDAGLKELAGLENLQELVLDLTQVTDDGLKVLTGLKSLKTLYLAFTDVTDVGIAAFQNALPGCRISR